MNKNLLAPVVAASLLLLTTASVAASDWQQRSMLGVSSSDSSTRLQPAGKLKNANTSNPLVLSHANGQVLGSNISKQEIMAEADHHSVGGTNYWRMAIVLGLVILIMGSGYFLHGHKMHHERL